MIKVSTTRNCCVRVSLANKEEETEEYKDATVKNLHKRNNCSLSWNKKIKDTYGKEWK